MTGFKSAEIMVDSGPLAGVSVVLVSNKKSPLKVCLDFSKVADNVQTLQFEARDAALSSDVLLDAPDNPNL